VARAEDPAWMKALTVGDVGSSPRPPADTPTTGAGAGRILSEESLDRKGRTQLTLDYKTATGQDQDEEEEDTKKSLSEVEAIEWILRRHPQMSLDQAARFVMITKSLRAQGRL
jgi:hypothetical protein